MSARLRSRTKRESARRTSFDPFERIPWPAGCLLFSAPTFCIGWHPPQKQRLQTRVADALRQTNRASWEALRGSLCLPYVRYPALDSRTFLQSHKWKVFVEKSALVGRSHRLFLEAYRGPSPHSSAFLSVSLTIFSSSRPEGKESGRRPVGPDAGSHRQAQALRGLRNYSKCETRQRGRWEGAGCRGLWRR